MTPRRTRAKDLRRKTETRAERRTILVFCEGEASEPDYVKALKRIPEIRRNTSVTIEVSPDRDVPYPLVERAVAALSDSETDECWCLFDVESPRPHPRLEEAVERAARAGVRVAVSNPCFELWLILHHRDQTASMTTARAEKDSRALDGRSSKRIDAAKYIPHRQTAAERARALARRHADNGTPFPGDNPSSSMGAFLDAVEGHS